MLHLKTGVAYLMNNVIISWGNRDKKHRDQGRNNVMLLRRIKGIRIEGKKAMSCSALLQDYLDPPVVVILCFKVAPLEAGSRNRIFRRDRRYHRVS